ncbi:hypothetical protein SEA_BAILEYBLU_50 [Arthrobacter phage BaileyBlu]|uniref:Uncharacterized protein n=1 Tax=Arthrobacter phage BaileyBlu TaxID=2910754 RepID=A0AA49BPZ7_9CAUD|nr:hypothetical protein PQD78_gp50 [Arthrobacter phage BaileyBlu]UJQ87188.1 hypothetical protein SEA_BAILEYBLU_50 [Arthrobacter phage BaileyBlu]
MIIIGHRPVYWCPTCRPSAIIFDVVAASAHEYVHPALRQIGSLPIYAPYYY